MGEEERLHWGSSFRQVLTILSAGRQAEGDQRADGLFRPLGMTLRRGTGAGSGWESLHTQLNTGNPRPVGICQPN